MSGGTPTQNAVMLTLVCLLVLGAVAWVVIGRRRRAWATGSQDAGSVHSRGQAKEIADRLYSYCSAPDRSSAPGDGATRPRVRVQGAARLMRVLNADDRFEVTPRDSGGTYWSFTVDAPGDDDLGRGVVDILARNGVTALAAEA